MSKNISAPKKINYILKPNKAIYNPAHNGGGGVCAPGLDGSKREGCCNK